MTKLGLSIHEDLVTHYGIKKTSVHKICADLGFAPNLLIKQLTSDQKAKYYKTCRSYPHGSRVLSFTKECVRALIQKGCLRGLRLKRKLPVRGQRTRTNAKTIKRWKL